MFSENIHDLQWKQLSSVICCLNKNGQCINLSEILFSYINIELLRVRYRTVKIKQIKFLPNICRKLMCISLMNLRIKMKSSHQMPQAFKCSWGGNLTQLFEKSRLILHLLMASFTGTCFFFWWHGSLLISMETLFAFLSWGSIPSATQTAIPTL